VPFMVHSSCPPGHRCFDPRISRAIACSNSLLHLLQLLLRPCREFVALFWLADLELGLSAASSLLLFVCHGGTAAFGIEGRGACAQFRRFGKATGGARLPLPIK